MNQKQNKFLKNETLFQMLYRINKQIKSSENINKYNNTKCDICDETTSNNSELNTNNKQQCNMCGETMSENYNICHTNSEETIVYEITIEK